MFWGLIFVKPQIFFSQKEKILLKKFVESKNSCTFASAFRVRPVSNERKSSLKVLHKTEEVVVQEAEDFVD